LNSKENNNDMAMYVTNAELLLEIQCMKDVGKMSERLGFMIKLIAENLAHKPNFSGYTYIDDMIGEAILTTVKYIKNFNPVKSSNPFAYITQICYNNYIAYINKQHRNSYIKDTLYRAHEKIDYFEKEYSLGITSINYRDIVNQFGDESI
jgi:hypothetical protein